ncbi:MarR family winged helix-turn-helix transcriptional regulator [Paratractidigestivibacter sp.]|uniref:MarR family winged helix-turn-helix transcriptional regulator n=1 Tax=Paratractidigestivibacter sp. TaxID=2847316 RepID=UPI002ABE5483|nr:MarR family transcriptional regulator [Paratractidigestivibacter sp.]
MFEERFEDFVGLIATIEKEIQRIKTAELARFGLRAGDLMCVYNLQKHPEGLTSAELARLAGIDRAAVSRVVCRLSAEGFIEVGEDDGPSNGRYRAPLRLTEKGHAVMVEVDDIIRNVVSAAGSGLSAENREAMYKSLSSVLEQLKNISV